MANVNVTISNLGAEDPTSHNRSATYAAGTGNPAWTSVASDGEIDLSNPGTATPAVNLVFTLPSGHNFASTDGFTTDPVSSDFSIVSGGGTGTLTVSDSNNDATTTNYEYTLNLSDGSKLDPKVINH